MSKLNSDSGRLRAVLGSAVALCLLLSLAVAQEIGHLGVSADPIPLVQARRPVRRYVARNAPRPAISRPDPDSVNLLVDLSDIGDAQSRPANPVALPQPAPRVTTPAPGVPALSPFEVQLVKAEELTAKNDRDGALAAFRQALALKPTAVEARARVADLLADRRDYAGADAEYQQVIAQKPDSIEARRGRADVLYQLKKYPEAVEEYRAAIKAGASDAGIYNNLANALYRTNKRENRQLAIDNYRQAVAKQPDAPASADYYAGLANALRTDNKLTEARQAVETALKLAPDSALAHSVAGRVYADQKDFARANAEGQQAVKLAPRDAFVHLNLGGIYYAQGRNVEAITAYTAAQSYDRTWSVPRNSLGNVYLNALNRPAEAIDEFEAANKLEPSSSIIHNNLGAAYQKQAKFDQAEPHYREAARLDPDNPSPLFNLAQLEAGRKKYDEAIALIQRAQALDPEREGQYQLALGRVYEAAKRKKEAKAAYARAEQLGMKVK